MLSRLAFVSVSGKTWAASGVAASEPTTPMAPSVAIAVPTIRECIRSPMGAR
jgi:hypothetical protein